MILKAPRSRNLHAMLSSKQEVTWFEFSRTVLASEHQVILSMCQEVAHTFGLDHQSTDGSSLDTCMDYFSNTGVNAGSTLSTKPNAHDFQELSIIYEHLDSSTTVAQTKASSSADDVSNDPNSWGMLVSQSANGRSSTYERYNHDGTKVVTHVTWTIEAASNCASCDHRYDGGH